MPDDAVVDIDDEHGAGNSHLQNPQLFDAAGRGIRLSGTMDYWADLEHRGLLRPVCPRHPSNSLLILEWQ